MDSVEGWRKDWVNRNIGFCGFRGGPDAEVLGKSEIMREVCLVLNELPADRYSSDELKISFSVTTEGSSFIEPVKSGPGSRSYDPKDNWATVEFGVTLEDLHLPVSEFRRRYSSYVLAAYDHLVPFLIKKGVKFKHQLLRSDMLAIFDEHCQRTDTFLEPPRHAEVTTQFLRRQHPEFLSEILSGGTMRKIREVEAESESD